MRILQVHNYYKYSGGEDSVLDAEKKLLEENGHTVLRFTKHNTGEIGSIFSKLRLLFRTHYSIKSKKELFNYFEQNKVDIVHVHNFFPIITPSLFDVTSELNLPTVMTLHNFRLIHPNGLLLYNGKIDERSVKGSAFRCVLDGVYRNSIIQTAIVAFMIEYHRWKKTWHNKVDSFIVLSEFSKNKLVEGGLPEQKLIVKFNFVEDYLMNTRKKLNEKSEYYIYVGRLSEEKGVSTLADSWKQLDGKYKLFVLGEGPLKYQLEGIDGLTLLGHLERSKTLEYIKGAKALIFPSICYENFPIVIAEAFSFGIPVICSNKGSHATIVEDGVTGLHFEKGSSHDLTAKVKKIDSDSEFAGNLGKSSRDMYEKNLTATNNYSQLIKIYEGAKIKCLKSNF